jgi:hypothetical protein
MDESFVSATSEKATCSWLDRNSLWFSPVLPGEFLISYNFVDFISRVSSSWKFLGKTKTIGELWKSVFWIKLWHIFVRSIQKLQYRRLSNAYQSALSTNSHTHFDLQSLFLFCLSFTHIFYFYSPLSSCLSLVLHSLCFFLYFFSPLCFISFFMCPFIFYSIFPSFLFSVLISFLISRYLSPLPIYCLSLFYSLTPCLRSSFILLFPSPLIHSSFLSVLLFLDSFSLFYLPSCLSHSVLPSFTCSLNFFLSSIQHREIMLYL